MRSSANSNTMGLQHLQALMEQVQDPSTELLLDLSTHIRESGDGITFDSGTFLKRMSRQLLDKQNDTIGSLFSPKSTI